jgi:hypothetical protein
MRTSVSATREAWSRSCSTIPTEIPYQVERLELVAQVQVVGRLVEEYDAGVLRQAGGEPDTLHLPAGELSDLATGHVAYSRDPHGVVDGVPVIGGRSGEATPVRMASERDDLRDRQPLGSGPRLGEQRDFTGELTGAEQSRVTLGLFIGGGLSIAGGLSVAGAECHPAAVHPMQSGEGAQQRGLPAAVRPHQGGRAAGFQGDRDTVNDRLAAVAQQQVVPVERGHRGGGAGHGFSGGPGPKGACEHEDVRSIGGARTAAPSMRLPRPASSAGPRTHPRTDSAVHGEQQLRVT